MSEPAFYAIVVVDIEGYGRRPDPIQTSLRESMYQVVRTAFTDSHLDYGSVIREDRGDGIIMLVPGAPTLQLAGRLIPALDAALREKAKMFSESHAMRFRVALHQGLCGKDKKGWSGTAINTAARLVDAQPLKDALAAAQRAQLAFIVSDEIHNSVIRHDYRSIDSSTFGKVLLSIKELEQVPAWIQVPGYSYPPDLPEDEPVAATPGPATPGPVSSGQQGGVAFHNSKVRITGGNFVVGNKTVRGRR